MAFRRFILTCFLLSLPCPADTSGIAGSILGFFFDPANGLQPILGITGASTIGEPVHLQTDVSRVAISSQQDYALAVTTPDALLVQVSLADPISVSQLSFPVSATGLVALSPTGSAAAVYDRDHNLVQVIMGLPATAYLAREVDLSGFGGTLTSLAISDAGDTILAGFSDSLVVLASEGNIRTFATPQRVTAAAFLNNSRDAVIADKVTGSVYLVRDVTSSSEPILIAGDQSGIVAPIGVAVSKDNRQAIVIISRGVAAIALSNGAVTLTSCPCQPSGLAALNGNAVFRLTEPSGGPLWLFDGDAPQPAIVFVPPYQTGQEGSR